MANRSLTQEQLRAAKQLFDNGASATEVRNATGISYNTLRKYFPRPDPKPGGPGRPRKKVTKPGPTDEQLTGTFTKVAVAPAIPAGLWLKCDYCAGHFVRTGPDAAAKLVELSHDHPALRNVMEMIWRWGDEIAWASVLGLWLGVPVAHHAAPEWLYRWIAPVMGMPPRNITNGHVHVPPAPDNVTPPFNPLEGMDAETLMRMAEGFGVRFEPATNGADAPTSPAAAEPAAEPAAPEGSEAPSPDSDAS